MEELGYHRMDVHEILYLESFRISAEIEVSVKANKNNGYFTSIHMHIDISLISS
jgi:hypothetical protein